MSDEKLFDGLTDHDAIMARHNASCNGGLTIGEVIGRWIRDGAVSGAFGGGYNRVAEMAKERGISVEEMGRLMENDHSLRGGGSPWRGNF